MRERQWGIVRTGLRSGANHNAQALYEHVIAAGRGASLLRLLQGGCDKCSRRIDTHTCLHTHFLYFAFHDMTVNNLKLCSHGAMSKHACMGR